MFINKFIIAVIKLPYILVGCAFLMAMFNVTPSLSSEENYSDKLLRTFKEAQGNKPEDIASLSEAVTQIFLECCREKEQAIQLLKESGFDEISYSGNSVQKIEKLNELYRTDKTYNEFISSSRIAHPWLYWTGLTLILPLKEYSVILFLQDGKVEKVFAKNTKTHL